MTVLTDRWVTLLGSLSEARRLWRFAVLALVGAMAGLGQAPWGLWPLTILALAVALAMAAQAPAARMAAFSGWSFGFGYFAWSLQWLVNPFFVDIARHGWMAPFAITLMAAGLALFWGVAFWGGRRSGRVMALAAALALAEVTRSLILTGFPWALLGHVWIDTPLAQLAAAAGPFGLTLLTVGFAGVLARWGARVPTWGAAIAGVAGWLLLDPGPAPFSDLEAPMVRIVQPNARQSDKWDIDIVEETHRRLLRLTAEGPEADLTVWPETAVPWLLEYSGDILAEMAIAARRQLLVTGIQRRDVDVYYNSLVVIGPEGEVTDLYDKWHLVPFGEYIPFGENLADLGIRGLAARDGGGYAAGPGPALVDLPGIGPGLPLICYEGIFAEEVNASDVRPRVLLLITNDAWFGVRSGPQQHFAQGRLRAIELGVPMVRAANTGISGVIDGKGRILGSLPMGEAGALFLPLPPVLPATVYARTGDLPAILAIMGILGLGAVLARWKAIDPARQEV